MTDTPKGSFIPVDKVLPNQNEPDWETPLDIFASQNSDKTSEDSEGLSDPFDDSVGNLTPEKILAALSKIESTLNSYIEQINKQGAELFKSSNYQEATSKAELGKNLTVFSNKVSELHNDWIFLSKEISAVQECTPSESKSLGRHRRTPSKLAVQFEDGESIFESSAAETFRKALIKIGVQRIEALGIQRLNHPLVSKKPPEKKYTSNRVGEYFIITHFSTEDKRKLLLQISDQLAIKIKAELVD